MIDMNIAKYLDYELCYVENINDCDSYYELWFTDSFDNVYGDDWNDRPACCNAGTPYEDKGDFFIVILSCPYYEFISSEKTYSIDDINSGVVPYFIDSKTNIKIDAKDTLLDLIKKVTVMKDVNLYLKYNMEDDVCK